MWKINALSILLVLVCALLLTNEVNCQDDATNAPAADDAGDAGDTGDTGDAVDTSDAGGAGDAGDAVDAGDAGDAVATPAPDAAADSDNAQTAAAEATAPVTGLSAIPAVDAAVVEDAPAPVMPDVKCVGKEDITESNAVKASVATNDCEATKNILEAVPANWCSKQACKINIFQDDSTVLLDSDDASLGTLASALQSDEMKNKLGVKDVKFSSSSGSSVLVGILVTGLLGAVALTVGYFKCQSRPSPKGERLAEEGTPVDQQNQANTLASDAPLNPPPETPEKPSTNGEAPEGDKSQPPPTNGHSTPATTADTEL